MILDNLKNAHLYTNVSERIALGLKYLQETDLDALEVGKYEIDGTNVFASVMAYDSRTLDLGKWEAHKKYIDIQYIISGAEKMYYSNISNMVETTEYNEVKDIMFYKGEGDALTVREGNFAIFFPEDVHMPNIAVDAPAAVKKVVVKIAL
jgi:YhcH/YjgK/YiaL family protein